jgi:hypothetical protein
MFWQDWTAFEQRKGFIMWAEPAPTEASSERYAITCDYYAYDGWRWARVSPNPDISPQFSSRCFYSDMPGGTIEACKNAVKRHRAYIVKLLGDDL